MSEVSTMTRFSSFLLNADIKILEKRVMMYMEDREGFLSLLQSFLKDL